MRPTVLVVEDEAVVGLFIREMLLDAGFAVHLLDRGAPALGIADEKPISAAIIDVGLPDLMGDRLAVQLRARHPTMPILLATGYDERTYASQFAGDCHVRVLSKPFDGPALLQELNALAVHSAIQIGHDRPEDRSFC